MLLETLDLKTNDILIYSQNLFNFNDSFKIIYKKDKVKRPHHISYFDVCNYVKDPSPKNLLIYRLLTNVNNLDAYSTKYGYFIKINGKIELVYFDPIFAIKDLRHLRFDLDPQRFRFKIQQVGLTSLTRWESEPDFAEIYSFDLKAVEAQHQNDKIFADAIFAFDPDFIDKEFDDRKEIPADSNVKTESTTSKTLPDTITSLNNISEDSTAVHSSLSLPLPPDSHKVQDLREEIITILKQALNIADEYRPGTEKNQNNRDKVTEHAAEILKQHLKTNDQQLNSVFDLFKSTQKSEGLSDREKESVILKFTSNR